MAQQSSSLEAKIVVLGSQGVGKTSLVHRFVKNAFIPPGKAQSTVGANFVGTRVQDPETNTVIRLQIWDTAGQERFRSISRLYYRSAQAAIVCYDVTNKKSFEDMGVWIRELKENCGDGVEDMIIHVVGTKSDVVAQDPNLREVPFERCIGYVAEKLYPEIATTTSAIGGKASTSSPPTTQAGLNYASTGPPISSPVSNRSSGFWGQEHIWDCCHEVSAKDGEGIDEVFRVITRKLVEQHGRRQERQRLIQEAMKTPGVPGPGGAQGYFDLPNGGTGSFRVGIGDKRRSWMGFATPGGLTSFGGEESDVDQEVAKGMRKGRCC